MCSVLGDWSCLLLPDAPIVVYYLITLCLSICFHLSSVVKGYGEQNYLWDAQGVLNTNTTTKLSRTYARAIAGTATHMHFDPTTASFLLEYTLDTRIDAPTEVYANFALQYARGYQVTVRPERSVRFAHALNNINLVQIYPREGAVDGTKVTVSIKREE